MSIGEQHRRQDPVALGRAADARQELLDLAEDGFRVADPGQVILTRELDVGRPGDVFAQVAPGADPDRSVPGAMEHQRGHADRRKDGTDVDLGVHAREGDDRRGTRSEPQVASPVLAEARIVDLARRANLQADRAAPVASHLIDERLVLLRRGPPRVVGVLQPSRVAPEQDDSRWFDRDAWPRTARTSGHLPRCRATPRAPTRRLHTPSARPPSAFRASGAPTPAPGRRDPFPACRTGSGARTTRAARRTGRAMVRPTRPRDARPNREPGPDREDRHRRPGTRSRRRPWPSRTASRASRPQCGAKRRDRQAPGRWNQDIEGLGATAGLFAVMASLSSGTRLFTNVDRRRLASAISLSTTRVSLTDSVGRSNPSVTIRA